MASLFPYGNVRYADPGYLADGVHRYPLERRRGTLSPGRIRNAWARFHQNLERYTVEQRGMIEGRIRRAAATEGIELHGGHGRSRTPSREKQTTKAESRKRWAEVHRAERKGNPILNPRSYALGLAPARRRH